MLKEHGFKNHPIRKEFTSGKMADKEDDERKEVKGKEEASKKEQAPDMSWRMISEKDKKVLLKNIRAKVKGVTTNNQSFYYYKKNNHLYVRKDLFTDAAGTKEAFDEVVAILFKEQYVKEFTIVFDGKWQKMSFYWRSLDDFGYKPYPVVGESESPDLIQGHEANGHYYEIQKLHEFKLK